MLNIVKRLIEHPLTRGLDIDSPEATRLRCRIIKEKPFLRRIYEEWYETIKDQLPGNVPGPVLELGSGGGFLDEHIPGLITSEVLPVPGIGILADARRLPFRRGGLSAIVMIDVLHHIPDVESFFKSAADCVGPGGRIIMIEPWVTEWSRFVYTKLHHEPFEPETVAWRFPKGGPLSQANSALPWIVFCRDREKFERMFPEWQITRIDPHMPLSYLLSGGVSMRSLIPGALFDITRKMENRLNMENRAMFATIVITRKAVI